MNSGERETIERFHQLYYDLGHDSGGTWHDTYWMGTPILKCPLDMWIYQELIHEQRPDLIIETGTWNGGSALYMASLMDILGHGRIITIDLDPQANLPEHPRITYWKDSSVAPEILAKLHQEVDGCQRVLVILDSDHSEAHVREELKYYPAFVTLGSYLILEDTNVNGHPAFLKHGPGPMEALNAWLPTQSEFEIDSSREKFLLTMNPSGYLRRVRPKKSG